MKKNSILFVLLLLIVSIFAMSCEEVLPVRGLNEEEINTIAKVAMGAFMHTGLYIEASVDYNADPNRVGNDGLDFEIDGLEITIDWDNYDIGASIEALLDDEGVDEDYKEELLDIIDEGQVIIISGTAMGVLGSEGADIIIENMKLKINNLTYEDEEVPNGIYDIGMDLSKFGGGFAPVVNEITVNGIFFTLDSYYFRSK